MKNFNIHFSSKSGGSCLRDVVAHKRWEFDLETFGIFGKLVAEERWSQLCSLYLTNKEA